MAATFRTFGTIPVVREGFTMLQVRGLVEEKHPLRTDAGIGSSQGYYSLPSPILKYNQK